MPQHSPWTPKSIRGESVKSLLFVVATSSTGSMIKLWSVLAGSRKPRPAAPKLWCCIGASHTRRNVDDPVTIDAHFAAARLLHASRSIGRQGARLLPPCRCRLRPAAAPIPTRHPTPRSDLAASLARLTIQIRLTISNDSSLDSSMKDVIFPVSQHIRAPASIPNLSPALPRQARAGWSKSYDGTSTSVIRKIDVFMHTPYNRNDPGNPNGRTIRHNRHDVKCELRRVDNPSI